MGHSYTLQSFQGVNATSDPRHNFCILFCILIQDITFVFSIQNTTHSFDVLDLTSVKAELER